MNEADYSQQTDIFDPEKFTWPIHVIGVGGIGSALLPLLFKIGFGGDLHIWDIDNVEPHNIPAQLIYRKRDIGMSKVQAVKEFAERQDAECTVIPHDEFVTEDSELEGVVFVCVDSQKSRNAIWQAVLANRFTVPFFMDGRIGGEQLQLLTLSLKDEERVEAYETHWLFPDSQGATLPCAARTTIQTPAVLAGLMVANLTLFSRNLPTKANIKMHLRATQVSIN